MGASSAAVSCRGQELAPRTFPQPFTTRVGGSPRAVAESPNELLEVAVVRSGFLQRLEEVVTLPTAVPISTSESLVSSPSADAVSTSETRASTVALNVSISWPELLVCRVLRLIGVGDDLIRRLLELVGRRVFESMSPESSGPTPADPAGCDRPRTRRRHNPGRALRRQRLRRPESANGLTPRMIAAPDTVFITRWSVSPG